MSTGWEHISKTQQQTFLVANGLTALPDAKALTSIQSGILVGIVGENAAGKVQETATGTVSTPVLSKPSLVGDWSAIMLAVAEIQAKLGDLQVNVAVEDIENIKDTMSKANTDETERLQEVIEKLKKANKSGLIGKIFGWIGVAVGLIGAAIATAATGGAAWPALALALVGVGMMVLQETGAMEKIVDFFVDNPWVTILIFGPILGGVFTGLVEGGVINEDEAKMAMQVMIYVTMLATSVVGMIASGGASAASAVFKVIGMIGQIMGGITSVAGGAAGIAQSAYGYQKGMLEAEMQENKAWLAKLQQMMSEEIDRFQEIMDKLNQSVKDISDIIADIANSNRNIITNMGM